ncbi:MAG: type II secretion system F family protein [Deltaproteobacteria bacterium]|nr:type II secretion system F family protein [Deltaproteobacteria bacterium]
MSTHTVWHWEARARSGELKKGTHEAATERDVHVYLRQRELNPIVVRKQLGPKLNLSFLAPSVKRQEIVVFVRQFATMIDAGLPLVQCLDLIASQQDNRTFKAVLTDIKETVAGGSTFAQALKRHPKVFDDLFVNLVAAGEMGGILDTILNRLAAYIEKNAKLARQVKSAMAYPVGISVVAAVVIFVLLRFVIPSFESMFTSMGGQLPGLTQVVINLSHWLAANTVFVLAGGTAFVYGFKRVTATARGRYVFDGFMLKLPLFGALLKKVAVARFTRTMGTMLASGVPIIEALDIVSKASGNKVIEEGLVFVKEQVGQGSLMAPPLAKTNIFPNMVVQMIAVGESTGAMDVMLTKIADFYDDEVEAAVNGLTSMMEPLMMMVLGGIVGTILVAMYLPIFTIAGAVGG